MRQFVIIEAEVLNPVFDLKGQREGKAKGKQFVKQPKGIAKKTARYR